MKKSEVRIALALIIAGATMSGMMILLHVWGGGPPWAHAQAGTGVIRVATTGSDVPGCGSTATPCRTVQYAVDQAQPGDEVRVASGTYTGVQARPAPPGYPNPPASGLVTQVVYINKTLTVRGGYTTADWNTSDPDTNPTTLDAQGQGRVMVIAGDISATVEGLRITSGSGNGLGGEPWAGLDGGGGVYIISATATISDCQVFGNDAYNDGGGLFLYYSDATLVGNSMHDNLAPEDGGGLYLFESDATLTGNVVYDNTAWDDGGGLVLDASDATLTDNAVHDNTAWNDGGGLLIDTSAATFIGNQVYANFATDDGGGLYLWESGATLTDNSVYTNLAADNGGGVYLYRSTATLTGNSIYGNHAPNDSGGGLYLNESDATLSGNSVYANDADWGGGLYLWSSNATLTNNSVYSNTGTTDGGGLCIEASSATLTSNSVYSNIADWAGGGLCLWESNDTLTSNAVYSNTAQWGGGLYMYQNNGTLIGNSIHTNSAIWGGGLYLETSDPALTNNVVADNQVTDRGSGLYIEENSSLHLVHNTFARNSGGDGSGVHITTASTVVLTNTILVSHTVGITVAAGSAATLESTLWFANGADSGGTGTINTTHDYTGDPAFAADGYHLRDSSAALDRGVDAGVTTDIDGEARPQGAGYDIGADEWHPGCREDDNNDGLINIVDIQLVAAGWGGSDPDLDMEPDGDVDIDDIQQVVGRWSLGCP